MERLPQNTAGDTKLEELFAIQAERGQPATALFTDLDGTFFLPGNKAATAAATDISSAAEFESCPIISVTGRAADDVMAHISRGELPHFAAIIGGVSTEQYCLNGNGLYVPDREFETLLAAKNYDRKRVVVASQQIIDCVQGAIPTAKLGFQNPAHEAAFLDDPIIPHQPYKVSFHFFASSLDEIQEIATPFRGVFEDFKIVTCGEINYNRTIGSGEARKYCLDILPFTKVDAVNYVIKKYAIEQGIVAGDSGNDSDMLLDTPDAFASILVGGHSLDARAAIEERVGKKGVSAFQRFGEKFFFIDTHPDRIAAQSIIAAAQYLRADFPERRKLLTELK